MTRWLARSRLPPMMSRRFRLTNHTLHACTATMMPIHTVVKICMPWLRFSLCTSGTAMTNARRHTESPTHSHSSSCVALRFMALRSMESSKQMRSSSFRCSRLSCSRMASISGSIWSWLFSMVLLVWGSTSVSFRGSVSVGFPAFCMVCAFHSVALPDIFFSASLILTSLTLTFLAVIPTISPISSYGMPSSQRSMMARSKTLSCWMRL